MSPSTSSHTISLRASPLRPNCPAKDRIHCWRGVHTPPPLTIDNPIIQGLAQAATQASLSDQSGYGSGLMKFHTFCDIFRVPEEDRLPASFEVLHSFVLWAASDPDVIDHRLWEVAEFDPVSVRTVKKYLAGIQAWHLVQGWPAPFNDGDQQRIDFSLRGLAKLSAGKRSRPIRPPVTLPMLKSLKQSLKLDSSFDACAWAMATCAFWGMMRLGEATVASRNSFSPLSHPTRSSVVQDVDLKGTPYAKIILPKAKTAQPGEKQSVWLSRQGELCPITALHDMAKVTEAGPEDPLFSWRDSRGDIRPLVKKAAMERVNEILEREGWNSTFGHSFRIGGASYYLALQVDPEIVRLAGRWKSLAYEAYIRGFEQVISRHMDHVQDH